MAVRRGLLKPCGRRGPAGTLLFTPMTSTRSARVTESNHRRRPTVPPDKKRSRQILGVHDLAPGLYLLRLQRIDPRTASWQTSGSAYDAPASRRRCTFARS